LLSVQGSLVPLAPLPLTRCEGRIGCAGRVAIIKSRLCRRKAAKVGVPVGHGYNYFLACDTAERIIFAGVAGSGSGKLCWHSPFIRQRRRKALPVRIRGKSQLSIAREGFLDRRSKRCFWLLLSPQTKVARAGARNYPRRRKIMRLRRCAATPHPALRATFPSRGRLEGCIIQHREPLKGKA